jgi:hypothetical protein
LNKFSMGISRCGRSHGDNKKLLVLEGRYNAGFIIIVNICGNDAVGEYVGTILASECRDSVVSRLKKSSCDVCSNGAGCLD